MKRLFCILTACACLVFAGCVEKDVVIYQDSSEETAPTAPVEPEVVPEHTASYNEGENDIEFVSFQEIFDELERAEIECFDWRETGMSLGIAQVENADDITNLAEMFKSLTLEKMDYMEPTVEVFKIYLYADDNRAAKITITIDPWINDFRITDGELDLDLINEIYERNK